jgi:hypothetical protein
MNQHTMEPPPRPTPTLDLSMPAHPNSFASFSGDALVPSFNMYPDLVMHSWEPAGPSVPLAPAPSADAFDPIEPGQSSAQATCPPPNLEGNARRTIPSQTWIKHKRTIQKLWLEDDKPLSETMAIMAEKYRFTASYVYFLSERLFLRYDAPDVVLTAAEQVRPVQKAVQEMELVQVCTSSGRELDAMESRTTKARRQGHRIRVSWPNFNRK